MKTTIYYVNSEKNSEIQKCIDFQKHRLTPVFLKSTENSVLQKFNGAGIPYYLISGDELGEEWFRSVVPNYTELFLITGAEDQMRHKLSSDVIWQEEWELPIGKETDFLEIVQPLREVVARLLAPGGCPWDREQTHMSLRRGLIEESYEVIEAIETNDMALLKEELGDVLLQVVFHSKLAEEAGFFKLDDVVAEITQKMKRRHPHVFGDVEAKEVVTVLANWEEIKRKEKGKAPRKILDGIPPGLPALMASQKIQGKASKVGFDWKEIEPVWNKVSEEILELKNAVTPEEQAHEWGDVVFSLVNLARFLNLDAELALRLANKRFQGRFEFVEAALAKQTKMWSECSLEELDHFWEEAKRKKL